MDGTIYRSAESERTVPKLPAWAFTALQRWSKPNSTKGYVAYECILLANDEYSDPLTDIEEFVFDRLRSALGDSVTDALQNKTFCDFSKARQILERECEYADPMIETERTELWLPNGLKEQLPYRPADVIKDAICITQAQPWDTRLERLSVIRQLIELTETRTLPDNAHPFVRWCVEDSAPEQYDITVFVDAVERATSISLEELEFEDSVALSREDVSAEDIPATPERRSPVAAAIMRHEGGEWTADDIKELNSVTGSGSSYQQEKDYEAILGAIERGDVVDLYPGLDHTLRDYTDQGLSELESYEILEESAIDYYSDIDAFGSRDALVEAYLYVSAELKAFVLKAANSADPSLKSSFKIKYNAVHEVTDVILDIKIILESMNGLEESETIIEQVNARYESALEAHREMKSKLVS